MTFPLISRVHRLSMDDGPGLRDVVFLKGCRLRCSWCHNPEAMEQGVSVLFFKDRCIGCNGCVQICPGNAIVFAEGKRQSQGRRCERCGKCERICPAGAVRMNGDSLAPERLVELLLKDKPYFDNSGGGVTFSGGEPALHLSYLAAVSALLKQSGIHIVLETAGDFAPNAFRETLLPYIDLIYFDLKLMDATMHRRYTGMGNEHILTNFEWLVRHSDIPIAARTPLIPGITDTETALRRLAQYLERLHVTDWQKLPFNPTYCAKWSYLNRTPPSISHSVI